MASLLRAAIAGTMNALVCLAVILSSCGSIRQVDPGTRVNICASRLIEACKYSNFPLALKLKNQGEYVSLKHRFRKPDAIKVRYSEKSVSFEPHWRGEMVRFYSSGGKASAVIKPEMSKAISSMLLVNEFGEAESDLPRQMPRNIRMLEQKAIALGCSAFIDCDQVYFLPKYFRMGQDSEAYRQAMLSTIVFDVGELDLESLHAETSMRFGSLSADICDWLNTHPAYSIKRQYDCCEFPLEVQAKVKLAVELYWQTLELALIRSSLDLVK